MSFCRCDTKTKDNVFVRIVVSVQYQVIGFLQYSFSMNAAKTVQGVHNTRPADAIRLIHSGCLFTALSHYILQVKEDALYDAFYRLTNTNGQITSYVFDVVCRASVPMGSGPSIVSTPYALLAIS